MINFGQIKVGERFKYENGFFVRTELQSDIGFYRYSEPVNAISLVDQIGWIFDEQDQVERYQ